MLEGIAPHQLPVTQVMNLLPFLLRLNALLECLLGLNKLEKKQQKKKTLYIENYVDHILLPIKLNKYGLDQELNPSFHC